MSSLAYLLFNFAIAGSAYVMQLHSKLLSKLNKKKLLLAYLLVSLPFVIWDAWAVSKGHWGFNPQYILGIYIGNLALEEVLFFITVPLVMLLVYQVVLQEFPDRSLNKVLSRMVVGALGLQGLFWVVNWPSSGYTVAVGLASVVVAVLMLVEDNIIHKQSFWVFQGLSFALFIAANSVLTSLPIIIYGESEIIGTRIGTIPIEDFLYKFALINSFITVYYAGLATKD